MVVVLTNLSDDDNGNKRKIAVDFSKVTKMEQYGNGSKIFTTSNNVFTKESLEEIADKLNSLYSRYNNTLNVYYKPSQF
jgi:hypothetical protein